MTCVSRLLIDALCFVPMVALAQTAKEAKEPAKPPASSPTPVSSTPDRTTASFGDWVVRCDAAPAPTKRVCEVAQAMTVGPVGADRADRIRPRHARRAGGATVVLPVAVTLTAKPKILSEKDDKSPIELTWQRCIPGGCIASAAVAETASISLPGRDC